MNTPVEDQLGAAFRDLAAQQPFTPDVAAINHRIRQDRRRTRMFRGGIAAGVVAVAAVVSVAVTSTITSAPATTQAGGGHPAPANPAPANAAHPATARHQMVQLAAELTSASQPAGDATLVQRQTTNPGSPDIVVWDLYADDGRYFFSQAQAGLPAQVKGNHTLGGGQFGREVAAAEEAADGDVSTAALKMAWPYSKPVPGWLSAQVPDMSQGGLQIDNYVWEDSQDALIAGAGNPQVRAGVLRLVAALPGVTVTHGTVKGQPALTITAGSAEFGTDMHEAISINASTGIPLETTSTGANGETAGSVTYVVTRVSLADIAAGKF
jgi:hypothetical protein